MKLFLLYAALMFSTSLMAKGITVGLGEECELNEANHQTPNIVCSQGLSCIPNPYPVGCGNGPTLTDPKNINPPYPAHPGICAQIKKVGESCCNPKEISPCTEICAPGSHCYVVHSGSNRPIEIKYICRWDNCSTESQTSTDQVGKAGNGKIYPNPYTDGETLCLSDNKLSNVSSNNRVMVQIFNASGQSIQSKEISSKSSSGDCALNGDIAITPDPPLTPGIYMFKVTRSDYSKTYKVVTKGNK